MKPSKSGSAQLQINEDRPLTKDKLDQIVTSAVVAAGLSYRVLEIPEFKELVLYGRRQLTLM